VISLFLVTVCVYLIGLGLLLLPLSSLDHIVILKLPNFFESHGGLVGILLPYLRNHLFLLAHNWVFGLNIPWGKLAHQLLCYLFGLLDIPNFHFWDRLRDLLLVLLFGNRVILKRVFVFQHLLLL